MVGWHATTMGAKSTKEFRIITFYFVPLVFFVVNLLMFS